MGNEAELLPGTLDLLILKAVSLGHFMATAFSCASGKFPGAHYSSSKERSIPPCSVWCARAFSRQAGESRITIVAASVTNSRRKDASVCARKALDGTVWSRPLPPLWRRTHSKYESESVWRL